MLVSIDNKTAALGAVLHARHFAINYLGRDARALADMFAGKSATKGSARFEGGRWGTLTSGAPVFDDAIGVFDCVLEKTIEHFCHHHSHRPGGRPRRTRQRRSPDLFSRRLPRRLTARRDYDAARRTSSRSGSTAPNQTAWSV